MNKIYHTIVSHHTFEELQSSAANSFQGKVKSIDLLRNGKGRISSEESTLLLQADTIEKLIGCDPIEDNLKAVTALNMLKEESLLFASHIKPWSDSNNKERLDPYNGFLLTPNLDVCFDKVIHKKEVTRLKD